MGSKPQIRWDAERERFLSDHYPHMTLRQLTAEFNRRFDHAVSMGAIGQKLHGLGLRKRPCG